MVRAKGSRQLQEKRFTIFKILEQLKKQIRTIQLQRKNVKSKLPQDRKRFPSRKHLFFLKKNFSFNVFKLNINLHKTEWIKCFFLKSPFVLMKDYTFEGWEQIKLLWRLGAKSMKYLCWIFHAHRHTHLFFFF